MHVFMELKLSVLQSLQILVEPVDHVSASFFCGFHGERIVGVVSASEAMRCARKDLHKVINLQPASLI